MTRPWSKRISRPMATASAICAVLSIGLSGCATATGSVMDPPEVDYATAYPLGANDQLNIVVYRQPELTGAYVVDNTGNIAMPLLGSVKVAGLTPDELDEQITASLGAGNYFVDVDVVVQVAAYRPFYILGEVNSPGEYPFSAGLTVASAVATAKGYTPRANQRRVYVKRVGETDEKLFRVTPNMQILPGDTIRVPQRFL